MGNRRDYLPENLLLKRESEHGYRPVVNSIKSFGKDRKSFFKPAFFRRYVFKNIPVVKIKIVFDGRTVENKCSNNK